MKPKAKQNKGRDCRLNATVTIEEKAALDRLAAAGGFKSTSALIGAGSSWSRLPPGRNSSGRISRALTR